MDSDSRLRELERLGQSVWIDWLTRDLLVSGGLTDLIDRHGVSGLTTNPTILEQALLTDRRYESQIRSLAAVGRSSQQILRETVRADVDAAAQQLLPVWQRSNGRDGFVSWEVDPALAWDTQGTFSAVKNLRNELEAPNLLVKIPATPQGVEAFEEATAAGLSVNVTLLFSVRRYVSVAEAYLRGLERARAAGVDLTRITSVASFFVSRLDAAVDPMLEADRSIPALVLRGALGIASARQAYQQFRRTFSGERWAALRAKGARGQRLLWASTSTKDPDSRDVRYVEELIGPATVTTLPRQTLEAFLDHGIPRPATLVRNPITAEQRLSALKRLDIDVEAVASKLEAEGVARFAASTEATLRRIESLAHPAAA